MNKRNIYWWVVAGLTASLVLMLSLEWPKQDRSITPKISLPLVAEMPQLQSRFNQPQVTASHVFVLDRGSKTVLYQNRADERIYPASTTKMMTALIALDNFALDTEIEVRGGLSEGQKVGFMPGERVTVEQLLYGMLVQSGNDAAEILAVNLPGGREVFIQAMNAKAAQLHLAQTRFANPTGLDEDGHYSTAVDLVRLADYGLNNSEFAKIVAVENAVLETKQQTHILSNINQLLGKIAGVKGVKTGFTEKAGQALITLVERNGHEVLIGIVGSTDRFTDTRNLIDWVFDNFKWVKITPDTQG